MKSCPFCQMSIRDEAIKCRYCLRDLTAPHPTTPEDRRVGEGALRFTHSGYRYILGYSWDHFGIWDRERPGPAIAAFPRTDEGWRQSWNQFSAWEPSLVEVPTESALPSLLRSPAPRFMPLSIPSIVTMVLVGVSVGLAVVTIWAWHPLGLKDVRTPGQASHWGDLAGEFEALNLLVVVPLAGERG